MFHILFMRFLRAENAFWYSAESSIVESISLNRLIGIVKVSSFSGTRGRADGSSIPRKHLRPPERFSFTAKVIIDAHPEPNGAVTASGELLS